MKREIERDGLNKQGVVFIKGQSEREGCEVLGVKRWYGESGEEGRNRH